jgi:hypothetical protein
MIFRAARPPLRPDPNVVIDLTPHAFDVLTNNKRSLGKVPVIVTVPDHIETIGMKLFVSMAMIAGLPLSNQTVRAQQQAGVEWLSVPASKSPWHRHPPA